MLWKLQRNVKFALSIILISKIFSIKGPSKIFIMDQGTEFRNTTIDSLMKIFKIEERYVVVNNHNVVVETQCKRVLNKVKKAEAEEVKNKKDWNIIIKELNLRLNSLVNSYGYSAFTLIG